MCFDVVPCFPMLVLVPDFKGHFFYMFEIGRISVHHVFSVCLLCFFMFKIGGSFGLVCSRLSCFFDVFPCFSTNKKNLSSLVLFTRVRPISAP